MKPNTNQILGLSAARLLSEVLPQLPTQFAQGSTSLMAFLLMFSAQEAESGVEIRVNENAAMRELFGDLASLSTDVALKSNLEEASRSKNASLKTSDLDAANYELRRLLIALQTEIEAMHGKKARAAEKRIWRVLKDAADARVVKIG